MRKSRGVSKVCPWFSTTVKLKLVELWSLGLVIFSKLFMTLLDQEITSLGIKLPLKAKVSSGVCSKALRKAKQVQLHNNQAKVIVNKAKTNVQAGPQAHTLSFEN